MACTPGAVERVEDPASRMETNMCEPVLLIKLGVGPGMATTPFQEG